MVAFTALASFQDEFLISLHFGYFSFFKFKYYPSRPQQQTLTALLTPAAHGNKRKCFLFNKFVCVQIHVINKKTVDITDLCGWVPPIIKYGTIYRGSGFLVWFGSSPDPPPKSRKKTQPAIHRKTEKKRQTDSLTGEGGRLWGAESNYGKKTWSSI